MDGLPVHVFNEQAKRDPLHFKTAKGESFLQQMDRLRSFLDEQAGRYPDGNILAISHESPIIAAIALSARNILEVVNSSVENCGRIDLSWPLPPPTDEEPSVG